MSYYELEKIKKKYELDFDLYLNQKDFLKEIELKGVPSVVIFNNENEMIYSKTGKIKIQKIRNVIK